jgi:hypothetical protein
MTASRTPRRIPRRVVIEVVTLAILAFTVLYRFNTLGGALGGFDNDHFVPFAYAKQVEAGEQPLRDFAGAGLQGAWPSLTFELSAWAQRMMGESLRSEALLSVIGLALAAAVTFRAAALVAPLPVAAGMTALSVLIEPKLYSYPKVLVLALAAWLCARYARERTAWLAVALGALTAAAFLFRHDFSVYVATGAVTAIAIAAGGAWRRALTHAAAYVVIILICLAPSAWFVSQYAGLGAYFEDSLFAVRQESRRTSRIERGVVWTAEDGRRLTPESFLDAPQNAAWWLFYASAALPVLVLAGAAVRKDDRARLWPAVAPSAVMALLVVPSFLRGNTAARVSDLAPLMAVLWAVALLVPFRATRWRAPAIAFAAVTVIACAATAQSVWTVGNVRSELDTSGWSDSPGKIGSQAARRWDELGALPAAYWSGEPSSASLRAVQYLHQCTAPEDRVIVLSYQPELLPLADRRFGGGGFGLVPGLLFLYRNQASMIGRWRREAVPIVLMQTGPEDATEIPFVLEYLRARYREAGTIDLDGGPVTVFADTGRTPVRTFGASGLPCFR